MIEAGAQVWVGGQQGWMDMSYLTADSEGVPCAGVTARLDRETVLYYTPNASGGSYGTLPEKATVTVLGLNAKGLCYVSLGDETNGWLDMNALDVASELSWEKY